MNIGRITALPVSSANQKRAASTVMNEGKVYLRGQLATHAQILRVQKRQFYRQFLAGRNALKRPCGLTRARCLSSQTLATWSPSGKNIPEQMQHNKTSKPHSQCRENAARLKKTVNSIVVHISLFSCCQVMSPIHSHVFRCLCLKQFWQHGFRIHENVTKSERNELHSTGIVDQFILRDLAVKVNVRVYNSWSLFPSFLQKRAL